MRISTRHQHGSTWRALRVLRKGLRETRSRGGKGVDVRCADDVVAVATDTIGAQLIGEDEDDVGLRCHVLIPSLPEGVQPRRELDNS